jgi:hypothetical protein
MGTPSPAQRVLLGEVRRYRPALFTVSHHRCLGSGRALPYSADRGKKSVNRQALDDLKQQISLMGYLQAHDWQPARPLSRGRWMGLCPLHGDHKPSFVVDPHKDLHQPPHRAGILTIRNATGEEWGFLEQRRYVLHDRDTKFCSQFRATLAAGGIEPIQLPARSPNLNSHAERWVRSVKSECLSKLILFGEASLRRALTEFLDHFHGERNHQGKGNVLLFPSEKVGQQKRRSRVHGRERLGGLLKYYSYAA